MTSTTETTEVLKRFFGPDRGEIAVGIFLCLVHGDKLPRNEVAGVKVQEVQEAAKNLGLR